MKLLETKSKKGKVNYNLILLIFITLYLFYINMQIKSTQSKLNVAIGYAADAQSSADQARQSADNATYAAEAAQSSAEDAAWYARNY